MLASPLMKPFFSFVPGNKLETNCMTIATASVLFHKFQKAAEEEEYDNYVRFC